MQTGCVCVGVFACALINVEYHACTHSFRGGSLCFDLFSPVTSGTGLVARQIRRQSLSSSLYLEMRGVGEAEEAVIDDSQAL